MAPETTTVRIRIEDKAKLKDLCRHHKRGILHELSYLIDQAHNGRRRKNRRRLRRAG